MRSILTVAVLGLVGLGLASPAGAAPGEPEGPILLAQRGKGPKKVRKPGGASALDRAVERRFKATNRTLRQARAKVRKAGKGIKPLRRAMVAQFAARRALAKGNRGLARRLTAKAQRLARRAMTVARLGRPPGRSLGAVKAKGAAEPPPKLSVSDDADQARSAAPAPAPSAVAPGGGAAPKRKARRARAEEEASEAKKEAVAGDDEESIAGDDEESIAAVNAAEGEVPAEDALLDDDKAFDALDQPAGR